MNKTKREVMIFGGADNYPMGGIDDLIYKGFKSEFEIDIFCKDWLEIKTTGSTMRNWVDVYDLKREEVIRKYRNEETYPT